MIFSGLNNDLLAREGLVALDMKVHWKDFFLHIIEELGDQWKVVFAELLLD